MRYLFGWIYSIPGLNTRERDAYKAFHVFVITSYFFWVRVALFPFIGGAALLVDRGIKAILIISFLWFLIKAISAGVLSRRWNPLLCSHSWIMIVFVLYMLILGFYYNSIWTSPWSIISCGIYYITMTFVMLMGRGGDYFRCNWKLFLFFFYITFLLMILTSDIEMIKYIAGTDIEREADELRGTTTLAYSFRGVLQFALYFFLVACFWKERIGWKYRCLMIFTLFPYAYFQIYVQKFRSHILLIGLAFIMTVYYSIKNGHMKNLALLSCITIAFLGVYFSSDDGITDLKDRIENATINAAEQGDSKNFLLSAFKGERGAEFDCFWHEFPKKKKLLGGGFKGYFDATLWGRGPYWDSIHIGFIRPVLQGGVLFFLFFLGFFLKVFLRPCTKKEINEGLIVASKSLIMLIFVKNWVNPLNIGDACFEFFIIWLALGQIWSPPSVLMKCKFLKGSI